MADRWLRSTSRSSSVGSDAGSAQNVDREADNATCSDFEADITVRENPVTEMIEGNSDFMPTVKEIINSNVNVNVESTNISANQIQDMLQTVMAAIQSEGIKQTAALEARLTAESNKQIELLNAKLTSAVGSLKRELKEENEKFAASLIERFESANAKLREEFNSKLQSGIQFVSDKVDSLRNDTESKITNLRTSVDKSCERMSERMNAHIVQTRKELEIQGIEALTSSQSVLASVNDHQNQTELAVNNLRQEVDQSKEYVDTRVNAVTLEIQEVKQINEAEILKINATLDVIQAKLATSTSSNSTPAVQQNDIVRVSGQTDNSNRTEVSNTNNPSVSGMHACSASVCNDNVSMNNHPVISCNNDVNVTSELHSNNVDLSELTLPIFNDSVTEVPLHFLRNLEEYFRHKKTPEELRLPLVFRAVQDPFAKQWLSSVIDKLKNYGEFKKAFTELLWCPSRQSSVRSSIYLDRHVPSSGETFVNHFIRYANLASTLDPPMSETDLLSALTSHFEPRVQQGLICGNFKTTQDALAHLAKFQGLEQNTDTFRSPRRDYDRRDSNRRSSNTPQRDDRDRNRDRGDVNVRTVGQQTNRRNRWFTDRRQNNEDGRNFNRRGQGSVIGARGSQLNPTAPNFDPRNERSSVQNNRGYLDRDDAAQPLNN